MKSANHMYFIPSDLFFWKLVVKTISSPSEYLQKFPRVQFSAGSDINMVQREPASTKTQNRIILIHLIHRRTR